MMTATPNGIFGNFAAYRIFQQGLRTLPTHHLVPPEGFEPPKHWF